MIGQQNESKLMMQNKVVFVSRQRESTQNSNVLYNKTLYYIVSCDRV